MEKINEVQFYKLINKHLNIKQKQNIPFGKSHNYITGIDNLYKDMIKYLK